MKSVNDKIIYVGKAKSLKNRVRSYFSGKAGDRKTRELVKHIFDFDYIITSSEEQALILENTLIKKHRPKYNIMLKDDKRYPFLKLTMKEDFPRIFITREITPDGARYFGPYTDARSIRKILRMLEWIFPLRSCKRIIHCGDPQYQQSCMNYQLGKCMAPCVGYISCEDYQKIVNNVVKFLKGRNQEVIDDLKSEMEANSRELKYEKAAALRDKILYLQKLNRTKNIFFADLKDRDVLSVYTEDKRAAVAVLKVLAGKLINKEIYLLNQTDQSEHKEILTAFVKQYYAEKLDNLPSEIILEETVDDSDLLPDKMTKLFVVPQRGQYKALIMIARENAVNFLEEDKLKHLRKTNRSIFPVKELKDKLNLRCLPRKMICFDISNIQGSDTVASQVYFENGKPKKKFYRRYQIRTLSVQDDFAAMAEVITRFLKHLSEIEKPDLIVIDGGKGQLNAAMQVLKTSAESGFELISLAKRLEEIYLPGNPDPIILPRSSSALRLLISIRDEAHRFAISYHRQKRKSRTLTTELDGIKGIGEEVRFLLLKEFSSVANLKKAKPEDLIRVKGIGMITAKKILKELT